MYYTMDWEIWITPGGQAGDTRPQSPRQLAMIEAVEIHKSVDLLADTCVIKLPGAAYSKALRVEQQIRRGDKVSVRLGYNGSLAEEFSGYLLNMATDDGSLTLNSEDELFLLRVSVKDKQFKAASVKEVAQYLLDQTGVALGLSCTLDINYDKFVVSQATAYDVLKKIQEETKANIFIASAGEGKRQLCIQKPYLGKFGEVNYSFQKNIEKSDLKYVLKADKKIEVVVTTTGKDGKKKEVRFGTTGGEQVPLSGSGMDDASMKKLAQDRWRVLMTDGYEGSLTGWLIPACGPGYTAVVKDEDYEYKDGSYYVNSVTTTFDSGGAARKVELGLRVN